MILERQDGILRLHHGNRTTLIAAQSSTAHAEPPQRGNIVFTLHPPSKNCTAAFSPPVLLLILDQPLLPPILLSSPFVFFIIPAVGCCSVSSCPQSQIPIRERLASLHARRRRSQAAPEVHSSSSQRHPEPCVPVGPIRAHGPTRNRCCQFRAVLRHRRGEDCSARHHQ